ncbi:autoinducer 2 ABC transporter substrate-binding protein, partial [Sphingomonas koreensis]
HVGKMLIDGREPTDGMEIPGLGKVQVDRERRNIQGQKLEPINRQTIDRLVGLGL